VLLDPLLALWKVLILLLDIVLLILEPSKLQVDQQESVEEKSDELTTTKNFDISIMINKSSL
jgi:hypothetical protein